MLALRPRPPRVHRPGTEARAANVLSWTAQPLSHLPHLAYTRSDAVAMLGLVILSLALLGPHILGWSTFVGNGDRLHAFLNLRQLEVDAWQTLGRVPAWSDAMLLGVPVTGLHWIFLGLDPMAALMALAPSREVFRITGYITAAHLAGVAVAGYLLIRDIVRSPVPSFVGAALYACSASAVTWTGQMDTGFVILILQPLGLLLLRRLRVSQMRFGFLGLTLIVAGLVGTTFLQQVPYMLVFFGLYACHRLITVRDWRPLVVVVAASFVGILLATPRLGTVAEDFRELSRSTSLPLTCPCEVLRWFDESLFEIYRRGDPDIVGKINLTEGLEVYSSTFAALGVLTMLLRPRGGPALLAGISFLFVLVLVSKPIVGSDEAFVGLLVFTMGVALWSIARPAIGRRLGMQPSSYIRDPDLRFFTLFLLIAFMIVLSVGMRYLMYLAFFRVDFTHSRVAMAALLPLSVLAAVFVRELFGGGEPSSDRITVPRVLTLALGSSIAIGVVLALDPLGGRIADKLFGATTRLDDWYFVSTRAIGRDMVAGAVFVSAIGANWLARHVTMTRSWQRVRFRQPSDVERPVLTLARLVPAYTLGALMVVQAFGFAYHHLNGNQTLTYPVPFVPDSIFKAPVDVLRPPSPSARQAISERLETDAYRSVLTLAPDGYPIYDAPAEHAYGAFVATFWHLRVVNGYPLLSRRVAALPWDDENKTLRALSFSSLDRLPWPLLSVLNVKYAVAASPALLFNVSTDPASRGPEARPDDLTIVENPLPVLPRAFFARAIAPNPPLPARPYGVLPVDAIRESLVEGLEQRTFDGPVLGAEDDVQVIYQGDRVFVVLAPAPVERFLVVNELYHPSWHAYANGPGGRTELTVWPTNVVMRGILVPPGASEIELRFEPFMLTWPALLLALAGLLLGAVGWLALRRLDRMQRAG